MTVGFPAFMVDVAEFSLEHDSVQASSEVVGAGTEVVIVGAAKLLVTLDGMTVDRRSPIAEASESVSEYDSVQGASVVWARLDNAEVSSRSPPEERASAVNDELEEVSDAVKPD
jgi:hypothetical protein